MPVEILMPKFGLTMTQGTLVEWLKAEGDSVEKGEPLFEIESDKVVLEVEAPASGVLVKVLAAPGDTLPVGDVIGLIAAVGEEVEVAPAPAVEPAVAEPKPDRIKASPIARRIAEENGLDLAQIEGTGPGGRIVKEDVEQAAADEAREPERVKVSPVARRIAEDAGLDLRTVEGTGPRGRIVKKDVERALTEVEAEAAPAPEPATASAPIPTEVAPPETENVIPMVGVRRTIAERMAHSAHTTARVTLTLTADATEMVRRRGQLKAALANTGQPVPSYNDILIKLVAQALSEHPALNARLLEDEIHQLVEINVGLAVDMEAGLFVPVIRGAKDLSLREVAQETRRLIDRVAEGQFAPEDLQGGTFTITNLGGFEIEAFTPIINPPECAVLGVGRIAPQPVVREGEIVVRSTVVLSLTFDHRLVDGAPAARFLQRIKTLVENPVAALY
jgi:pyruvate dehydrogenase E2 component (dihydrolipoamide acetyltransferase)